MDGEMLVGVEDRLPGWIDHMKARGLADKSIHNYAVALKQFLTYCKYKRQALDEVGWQFLENWIRHLQDAKQAANTINCKLQAVASYYDFLVRLGVVKTNPRADVRTLKVEKRVPEFFSIETALKIIESAATPRNRAILHTLYCCGLRRSEITGINLEDVLWPEAVVRIRGKGKKERLVPIPIPCLDSIRAYFPERKALIERFGIAKEQAMFLGYNDASRFRMNGVYQIVQKTALLAGYEGKAHPHLFRHSYATHMYNNGADIRALQVLMGHAHIQTTEGYTHVGMKKLHDTVNNFHPGA